MVSSAAFGGAPVPLTWDGEEGQGTATLGGTSLGCEVRFSVSGGVAAGTASSGFQTESAGGIIAGLSALAVLLLR